MFSKRLKWDVETNRLSQLVSEKLHAGEEILDLTESNPTRTNLEYPTEKILASLAREESLRYEPHPRGLESARRAVAAYYRQSGQDVDVDQILLTGSTSEAYAHLFRLLGDPGDDFLVPRPSYPLIEYLAGLESIRLRPYTLFYEGAWHIDFPSLEESITPSTKALIWVNPNNPTGSFIHAEELARMRHVCRRNRICLVVDEVFRDYVLTEIPGRQASLVAETELLTFILNGLSKVSGLPQMKLGWILICGPRSLREQAMGRLELIADTFLSVNTPVQQAAAELLDARSSIQPLILERLKLNLRGIRARLRGTSAQVLPVEGGWYAVVRVPRECSQEKWMLSLLKRHNVLVHPGYLFDFPTDGYIVVSLLTTREIFQEGMDRFAGFLEA